MAFIIPNAASTASGARYENLDQAEPDSLDFEILGNNGRSGVLTGCVVSSNSNNTTVAVTSGVVVVNGVPYTVSADAALVLPTAPTFTRFDLVIARLSSGSVTLTVISGNDDGTNPQFPYTYNTTTAYSESTHVNTDSDVVLASLWRSGSATVTSQCITDKRVMLSSSVFSQGTTAPDSGDGSVGSLYYKTDVADNSSESGLYVKNGAGEWVELAQFGSDNITDTQLRNSTGLSVIGRSASTTGDPADIVAGLDGYVLRRSGTTLGFGEITGAGIADDAIDSEHYAALSIDEEHIANNVVTDTKLRDSAGLSVIGRAASSAGDPADIVAGADGYVLQRSGTTLGFGPISVTSISDGAISTAKIADNAISNTKLRDSAAVSVIGRSATTAGDPADIAIGSDRVLGRTGTGSLGSVQVSSGMIASNAVALGTQTTGNYVAGATAGSGISVTGTAGEGWSPTVAVDSTVLRTTGAQSKDNTLNLTGNTLGTAWNTAQLVVNPGGNAGISLRTSNSDAYTSQIRGGGSPISGRAQLYFRNSNDSGYCDISFADLFTDQGYFYVSNSVNRFRFRTNAVGYPYGDIDVGSVYVNGSLIHSSSRTIKHDIEPIAAGSLDLIDALEPVTFRYNHIPDQLQSGFIAEDVADVIPHAVLDNGDTPGIAQSVLLTTAIAAIQELSAKVKDLEARITELGG